MNTLEEVNLKLEESSVMAKRDYAIRQGERIKKAAKYWECSTSEAKDILRRLDETFAYARALKKHDD